jgi:hypothetical protein
VPHLLGHGTSVFPVSSEGPPHSVAFYDWHREVEDPILTRILKKVERPSTMVVLKKMKCLSTDEQNDNRDQKSSLKLSAQVG